MRAGKAVLALLLIIAIVAAGAWFGRVWEAPASTPIAAAQANTAIARGGAAFVAGDFGGISMHALETHALPWRLAAAALVLDEQSRVPGTPANQATLNRVLARFGFLMPTEIVNLPVGVQPPSSAMPLGMTSAYLAPIGGSRVFASNLGCAACHAGVTYDAQGQPQPQRVILGTPNTSIDLERYTLAVFQAMRRFADSDALLPTANTLFPDMTWRERQSLRWLVLPLAQRRIADMAGQTRPLPFSNGLPGTTNGVAALKAGLHVPLLGGGMGDAGIVSVPILANRGWRSSLLADGAYAPPGAARQREMTAADVTPAHRDALAAITTFFTVPSMGVAPERAHASVADGKNVMAFLATYRPQPFPGSIDRAAAQRGHATYTRACASCHGTYRVEGQGVALTRFPNWLGDVGTDRLRNQVFDAALVRAVAQSPYRADISVRQQRGYVGTLLTGVWATAPYLHNGSVPTIWALLTPSARPQRFLVGGHALSLADMGIALDAHGAYPAGYRPFAEPVWYDTRKPGQGNGGHVYGSDLSDAEKRDLIAFLSQL